MRSRAAWWKLTNPIYRFVCPYPAERLAGEILARRLLRSRFVAVSVIMNLRREGLFVTQALRTVLSLGVWMSGAFAEIRSVQQRLNSFK